MAKYISNSNGTLTEVQPVTSSSGAGDANKIAQLDSSGKFDPSLFPASVGSGAISMQCTEGLTNGDFVNIYDSGSSTFRIRKADANTPGKEAHGFVLQTISSGASTNVYFDGSNTGVSSLTPGPVYLSTTTPGGWQSSAPTGSGKIVQRLGVGTSATTINVEFGPAVVTA